MRIDDVSYDYEEFRYRTPYKFAGKEVDRATILNVRCVGRGAVVIDACGSFAFEKQRGATCGSP